MPIKQFMIEPLKVRQDKFHRPGDNVDARRERNLNRLGNANWEAFQALGYDIAILLEAASRWKKIIDGVDLPWLVWSMDEDWCYVQQKLVEQVGWTPIVGFDPRKGVPRKLTKTAVLIDFNEHLKLPVMWMHVPIDFIFSYAKTRMAFWHADLLCSPGTMSYLAETFSNLKNGEASIVDPTSKFGLKRHLLPKQHRYWELAGCITKSASQHMFDHGCSLWQLFAYHPNCPNEKEFRLRDQYYWDSGAGILYWHRRYKPQIKLIPEAKLAAGHFTRINRKGFKAISPNDERRDGGADLALNFTIEQAIDVVGLDRKLLSHP